MAAVESYGIVEKAAGGSDVERFGVKGREGRPSRVAVL